jgi:hypothetical protein
MGFSHFSFYKNLSFRNVRKIFLKPILDKIFFKAVRFWLNSFFLLNLDPAVIQSSMINSDSVNPVLIMNIQLDKSDNLRKGNLSEIFV